MGFFLVVEDMDVELSVEEVEVVEADIKIDAEVDVLEGQEDTTN